MKTQNIKQDIENITIHLVRISSDIEHIKEKVTESNKHLEKINGRVRDAEKRITAIKSIVSTLTFIIGVVLTWVGVQK